MSENLFEQKEGVFGSVEIPDSVKLGAVFLMLKGTYAVQPRPNGKIKTFISKLYRKNGGESTCMFDLSNPKESLSPIACRAIADSQVGLKALTGISFDELVSGTHSNEEIVEKLITANKETLYELNDGGVSGIINEGLAGIKENYERYVKALRESGALSSTALASLNSVSDALDKVANKHKSNTAKESGGQENNTNA